MSALLLYRTRVVYLFYSKTSKNKIKFNSAPIFLFQMVIENLYVYINVCPALDI